MHKIFLIPGMGADSRIYGRLKFDGYEAIYIDWIEPEPTDTLVTYAAKLIGKYHITDGAVLVGNSLGGMLAVEMAKIIRADKVILISSIKSVDESPAYFKLFRSVPVHKVIPPKFFTDLDFLLELVFGQMEKEDRELFKDMLKKCSPEFLQWAMGAVLNWDNTAVPDNVFEVVGDKDMVFPYKNLKDAEIIKGGTHMMIYDKAEEVNKFLNRVLKNEAAGSLVSK